MSAGARIAVAIAIGGAFVAAWAWRHQLSAAVAVPPLDQGGERLRRARETSEAAIRARVEKAGLSYPPAVIFIRAFKHEAQLELWGSDAGDAPLRLSETFPILKSSGSPGPKRREGDRQVPEGCYFIDRFNPQSAYHLSLGINYPNAADRFHADRARPGGDIFIHGSNRTIGCLPLGDRAIEELFLVASDVRALRGQRNIPVHIFPARMSAPKWDTFVSANAERDHSLRGFWEELQPIYNAFERSRRVPAVEVNPNGVYQLAMSAE